MMPSPTEVKHHGSGPDRSDVRGEHIRSFFLKIPSLLEDFSRIWERNGNAMAIDWNTSDRMWYPLLQEGGNSLLDLVVGDSHEQE
jgi:hypothetical protein